MAVYVDEAIWRWQGRKWCHLLADDVDELHRFAQAVGLHRISYQGPPRTANPRASASPKPHSDFWIPS